MSRLVLLLSIGFLVSGCSGLLHSDNPPVQMYVLRAVPASTSPANEQAPSLQLMRPQADPGLSSELITLVKSDHRMDHYAGSSWSGELPDVVETLAMDTLRASGQWSAVHDSPSPFMADYLLQINIRRFEADYTGGGEAPRVYVTLNCTLARRLGREVLASFVAEGAADAQANKMSAVVAGFQEAANIALAALAQRSGEALKTSRGPSTP